MLLLTFLGANLRNGAKPQSIPRAEDGTGLKPPGISLFPGNARGLAGTFPGEGSCCVTCLAVTLVLSCHHAPALTGLTPALLLPRHVGTPLRPGKHQRGELLCERDDPGKGAHDVPVEQHRLPQ